MMVSLSGNSAAAAVAQSSAQQVVKAVTNPSSDRTTAQDRVTISAQGQQAAQSAQGSDGDNDAS